LIHTLHHLEGEDAILEDTGEVARLGWVKRDEPFPPFCLLPPSSIAFPVRSAVTVKQIKKMKKLSIVNNQASFLFVLHFSKY